MKIWVLSGCGWFHVYGDKNRAREAVRKCFINYFKSIGIEKDALEEFNDYDIDMVMNGANYWNFKVTECELE